MLGRRRRTGTALWVAAAVSCLALAGACSDDEKGVTGATVPTAGDATTTSGAPTTTVPPSYDVPETIDQAYVQRVVSAYDKVLGDAIRVLKRDGVINEEFLNHLLAIYTADEFDFQQRAWIDSIDAGRLNQTPENPGDPVTTVGAIADASPSCIIARAEQDDSADFVGTPVESPQDDYVVLVRKKPDRDPLSLNPTPWVMAFDGFKKDNSIPRNSCGD